MGSESQLTILGPGLNNAFKLAAAASPVPMRFQFVWEGNVPMEERIAEFRDITKTRVEPGIVAFTFDHMRVDAASALTILEWVVNARFAQRPIEAPVAVRAPGIRLRGIRGGRYRFGHKLAHPDMPLALPKCTLLLEAQSADGAPRLAEIVDGLHRVIRRVDRCSVIEIAVSGINSGARGARVGNFSASVYSHKCARERESPSVDEILDWARTNRIATLMRLERIGRLPRLIRWALSKALRMSGYPRQSVLISEISSAIGASPETLEKLWFVVPPRSDRAVSIGSVRLDDGRRRLAVTGRYSPEDMYRLLDSSWPRSRSIHVVRYWYE